MNIQSQSNLKCQKHSNKDIEFIQINEFYNQNLFYCSTCVNEDLSFKGINYLLIQQIIDQGSSHIIQKWPPVNDYDIIKKLIDLTSINTQSSIVQQIIDYFNNLKEEIIKKLDICQKNMVNSALQLPLEREQIIKQYQDISSISQLRQLVSNLKQDTLQHGILECQRFVQQIESQKDKNTQLLQSLLTKSENIKSQINFEYPNAIKQTILGILDEVTFFNEEISLQNQPQQQGSNNTDKIDIIMKLISNESNYCSDSFLSTLKQTFKKINPVFELLSFDNTFKENKKPIDFSLINTEQLDLIDQYVNHVKLLKNNNDDYINSVKSQIKVKEISSLIKNQFNFTHDSFNEQFEKYIIDQYPFLDRLDFSLIFKDRNKFDFFSVLSDEILDNLFLLMQKRKELEQNNSYNQSQTQMVQNENEMIKSQFKNDEIDKIFKKYPIFDLIGTYQYNIPNIQLLGTYYQNNYNNIAIIKIGNSQYEIRLKESDWSQCILDLNLEQDKKYIFRFKIDSTDNKGNDFFLGLIQNKNISTTYGPLEKLCCYFQYQNNQIKKLYDYGINKQMKGNDFSQGDNMIEMRVCIQDQILEVLDYPYYQYKLGLNDNLKQNLHNYQDLRVCIGLYYTNSKVSLIDSLIVNQYVE